MTVVVYNLSLNLLNKNINFVINTSTIQNTYQVKAIRIYFLFWLIYLITVLSCDSLPFREFDKISFDNFICGSDKLVVMINGVSKEYKTVELCGRCWMGENLNVGRKIDSNEHGDLQVNNSIVEKYCLNNTESSCEGKGGLFLWNELMNYFDSTPTIRGICPEEWHVPTDEEWKDLEMCLGMSAGDANGSGYRGKNQAFKLMHKDLCAQLGIIDPDCGSSGFDLTFGGIRETNGTFIGGSQTAYFWTSTSAGTGATAYGRLVRNQGEISRGHETLFKTKGLSCRCIKD